MSNIRNIYYKRTAATAKPCYMCYRPTTTVLATVNTADFLYTCDGHLTDRGFATLIESQDNQTGQNTQKVGEEELRRIKEEWEERQRRKEERKEKEEGNAKGMDRDSKQSPTPASRPIPPSPAPIPVPGSSAVSKPIHQRYSLHREVFAMRLADHKRKRQNTAVKEVAPRLPITPRGGVA